jgi:hypothetical protein
MKILCQFFEGFETLKHMFEEMNSDKVLPKWKPNGWKLNREAKKKIDKIMGSWSTFLMECLFLGCLSVEFVVLQGDGEYVVLHFVWILSRWRMS